MNDHDKSEIDDSIITIESIIKPPKDMEEFKDRLEMFLYEKEGYFFGAINEREKPRKEFTPESLVKAFKAYESRLENGMSMRQEILDPYEVLKLVLEKDAYLFNQERYLLGTPRDRSCLSIPRKRAIAVQCAAQVRWHLEGKEISTIEAMVIKLLDRTHSLFKFLKLKNFSDPRTIRKWISPVFPVQPEGRKKWKSKDSRAFDNLIMIPNIFTKNGINFSKLRFALTIITMILKILGWELNQILTSQPILLLANPIQFYPRQYVDEWIEKAFATNGSIFGYKLPQINDNSS